MSIMVHKLPASNKPTLAEAGKWYAKRLSTQDKRLVDGWLLQWGAIPLEKITSQWVKAQITDPRLEEVSPGRVRRELAVFNALLNHAHRAGLMDKVWVERPSVDDRRLVWLTKHDRDAMIAAAEPVRFKAVVGFLFHTGARLNEALGARQSDVRDGCVEFVSHKGAGKVTHRRVVPIRKNLATLISAGLEGYSGPWLLPSPKGVRWHPRSVQRLWASLSASLGHGPEVVPHVARHTFVSLLIQQGKDPQLVAKLTGHRDPRSLARYLHLDTNSLKAIIEE